MDLSYKSVPQLFREYTEYLEREKASGKKLIAYCAHELMPEELIEAVGAVPIPLIFSGNEEFTSTGAGYLTPTMCPFALSLVGAFQSRKDSGESSWLSLIDGIIIANYSTSAQLISETIADQNHLQQFSFHIPYLQTPAHQEYYAKEIEKLIKELNQYTECSVSEENFASIHNEYTLFRAKLKKIHESNLLASEKLKITQKALLFGPAFLNHDDFESSLLSVIIQQSDSKVITKKNVILAGCSAFIGDPLLEFIENYGASIIYDDTWLGGRIFFDEILPTPNSPSLKQEALTLQKIANSYILLKNSPHFSPNTVQTIVNEIVFLSRKYECKSVIYHILKFCDLIGHHRQEIKDQLNQHGIQVLLLERDYSKAMSGQIRTRIEAFLEMSDH